VLVSGLVQGVFFRADTARHARSRGVTGWVRNLPEGRVEAVFEGPEFAVHAMVDWVRRGPRGATVTSVNVEWGDTRGEKGFHVR